MTRAGGAALEKGLSAEKWTFSLKVNWSCFLDNSYPPEVVKS